MGESPVTSFPILGAEGQGSSRSSGGPGSLEECQHLWQSRLGSTATLTQDISMLNWAMARGVGGWTYTQESLSFLWQEGGSHF